MKIDAEKIMRSIFDLVLTFSKMMNFNGEVENLRAIELYVLLYIAQRGPQKMSELAENFSMTKSNVTFLVDSLEEKGLVTRMRSDEDRRVIMIDLTEKVKESIDKFFRIFRN